MRITALLTLLCVLLSSLSSGGIGAPVLCVGADGHIAIESGGERCCADGEAPAGGDSVAPGCCDCTDIPLVEAPSLAPAGKAVQAAAQDLALAPGLALRSPAPPPRAARLASEPAPSEALSRLATVVLRL